MSDRLAHLNQLLVNLEAQLEGLEKALALAPMEDKARLRLLVQEKQREIQPYEQERRELLSLQGSIKTQKPSIAPVSPTSLPSATPMPASSEKTIILMLSANPKTTDPLRLDQERRDVEEGLRRSRHRDRFQLITQVAVRPMDIQRAMLDYEPSIVHFSGHGAGEDGLVLEDESGKPALVSGEALAGLFKLFADRLQCVVLNACYAEVQAKAIVQVIPSVVGMKTAIGDRAALVFAVAFYDALGAGREVEFAYKLGCSAIGMAGSQQSQVPVLLKKPQG